MAPEPYELQDLLGNAPQRIVRGEDNSLFLAMGGLGGTPPSGRLLNGLTPWLDGQGVGQVFLLTDRRWREPWQPEHTTATYHELVHWVRNEGRGIYRGTTWTDSDLKIDDLVHAFETEPQSLIDYAARLARAAVVSNCQPLRLATEYIPKPWGREGWLTGIETRGISKIRSDAGETPLPYALGMFPVPLMGKDNRVPILLKTLEPHAEAVLGDLYLEVHREKWETYVVLAVDTVAWPDGVGYLRAGINPQLLEQFRSQHGAHWESALRTELIRRIGAYENVRQQADELLAAWQLEAGLAPDQPIPPAHHLELRARLPQELRLAEQTTREQVEACLDQIPLRVGDAVALPPGVLHSLQHGITVVEFQTPTYERLIAMSTQKVLTQAHWDTAEAIGHMALEPFEKQLPEPHEQEGQKHVKRVERIVSYPEFNVDRITMQRGQQLEITRDGQYRLMFVVSGTGALTLDEGTSHILVKRDTLLIPATMGAFTLTALNQEDLVVLDAAPVDLDAQGA